MKKLLPRVLPTEWICRHLTVAFTDAFTDRYIQSVFQTLTDSFTDGLNSSAFDSSCHTYQRIYKRIYSVGISNTHRQLYRRYVAVGKSRYHRRNKNPSVYFSEKLFFLARKFRLQNHRQMVFLFFRPILRRNGESPMKGKPTDLIRR